MSGGFFYTYNGEGKELVSLSKVAGDDLFGGTGIVTVHDPTDRTRRGILTTNP